MDGKEQRYTVAEYMEWPEEERWELIDGIPYAMSAAPRVTHQNIVSNFHIRLKTHPENPCYTGIAPTDVVLDDDTVVQPDVFVVCDGEIHLLMTDVVLPEMSGKDLAREISKIRFAIRTLYMSGYTANVIAHQGVLDDGVHFIGKSFTPESLGRKVREAMGREK
jgi:CheY-like chemotaxis protein